MQVKIIQSTKFLGYCLIYLGSNIALACLPAAKEKFKNHANSECPEAIKNCVQWIEEQAITGLSKQVIRNGSLLTIKSTDNKIQTFSSPDDNESSGPSHTFLGPDKSGCYLIVEANSGEDGVEYQFVNVKSGENYSLEMENLFYSPDGKHVTSHSFNQQAAYNHISIYQINKKNINRIFHIDFPINTPASELKVQWKSNQRVEFYYTSDTENQLKDKLFGQIVKSKGAWKYNAAKTK